MSTAEFHANYRTPIASIAYVRSRLDLNRPLRESQPVDWDEVGRAVQDMLEELAVAIQRQRPGTVSRAGSNKSPAVPLYAYRVFEPTAADRETEPIVVGVACKRIPGGILVRGDFCEEDSGIVRFQSPECRMEVSEIHREVIRAASMVVARLAREKARLTAMLDDTTID